MMTLIGTGRFVDDPVLKSVNDTVVCEFALAVDEHRRIGGERKKLTSFLDFQIWDAAAKLVEQYCKKGDTILVTATPRQDKWVSKDGSKRSKVIFRVDNFEFMPRKQRSEEAVSTPKEGDEGHEF